MRPTPAMKAKIVRRFKSYREKHLMSQKDLSQTLGVARATVNRIERGYEYPMYSTLRKFVALEALGSRR